MREIKFRQAITEPDGRFRWHYWGFLHIDTAGLPVFISPLAPVEWDKRPSYQSTGLKDKNGVEIYEGDIYKIFDKTKENKIYEILFKEGCFLAQAPDGMKYHARTWTGDTCEVIGNIHENPKLLEGDSK